MSWRAGLISLCGIFKTRRMRMSSGRQC
uniref:Uncharacterized protein n=1 Tax=Rhizophora mucronata TaxID=61149 RepID=A0A2P2QV69_RHIMU